MNTDRKIADDAPMLTDTPNILFLHGKEAGFRWQIGS